MENENILTGEQAKRQSFKDLIRFAILALAIVVPIRLFVVNPFVVSGSSMFPTFMNRDYLIVDKISYRFREPERYDVIIFRYPKDPSRFFIKRIIGLPGETVDIKAGIVAITAAGGKDKFELSEPYVKNTANNNMHFELKNNEYFVLGDNRSGSSDSRLWGAVDRKLIAGRAFLRLLPMERIGVLPGDYN